MIDFIPHTKRRKMTKARAARIFLARNGICFNCRQQIRQGQAWFIEHPEAIAQGGSDADADLWDWRILGEQTALLFDVIERHAALDDEALIQKIGQFLHYFSNMTQMVVR